MTDTTGTTPSTPRFGIEDCAQGVRNVGRLGHREVATTCSESDGTLVAGGTHGSSGGTDTTRVCAGSRSKSVERTAA